MLHELNELNSAEVFGRWVFYKAEHTISLEYDMLGDHLQEPRAHGCVYVYRTACRLLRRRAPG